MIQHLQGQPHRGGSKVVDHPVLYTKKDNLAYALTSNESKSLFSSSISLISSIGIGPKSEFILYLLRDTDTGIK